MVNTTIYLKSVGKLNGLYLKNSMVWWTKIKASLGLPVNHDHFLYLYIYVYIYIYIYLGGRGVLLRTSAFKCWFDRSNIQEIRTFFFKSFNLWVLISSVKIYNDWIRDLRFNFRLRQKSIVSMIKSNHYEWTIIFIWKKNGYIFSIIQINTFA